MRPRDAGGMANRVVPDQTAPQEQSDLVLHCLYEMNVVLEYCFFLSQFIGHCHVRDTYMYEIVFRLCKATITAHELRKSSMH